MNANINKWVLITGAKGFVGTHVTNKIISQGYSVVGLKRRGVNNTPSKENTCSTWVNLDELPDFLKNKTLFAVLHLATDYGHEKKLHNIVEANVALPLELLSICEKVNCDSFFCTDTFYTKSQFNYSYLESYIYSKRDFSYWAKLFCKNNSVIKISNLRLEHVYGTGDKLNKFIPNLISKLLKNIPNIPMTMGHQLRDFIYVEDVAEAYAVLLNNCRSLPTGYSEYEVGTGKSTSIKELSNLASELIGSTSLLDYGALQHRNNEIYESKAATNALKMLGWSSKISLPEGLSQTISYYKNNANHINEN